jgi:hypothetical protein
MESIHTGQKFVWDAVPGATGYDFQILNASLGAVLADRPDLSVLEVTMEDVCAGLVLGTTYNAHVRAKDSFGVGQWSSPVNFQIVGPPVPANLRIV